MLNVPMFQQYNGETQIALMDNSTVAFMEQMERNGVSANELLSAYDAVLIPNWVVEEMRKLTKYGKMKEWLHIPRNGQISLLYWHQGNLTTVSLSIC